MSLAGEGHSVPLQDRSGLDGQGHCRGIWKGKSERETHITAALKHLIYAAFRMQNGCYALLSHFYKTFSSWQMFYVSEYDVMLFLIGLKCTYVRDN